MAQFLDKNGTQILANKINAVKAVADGAQTTANNAMPLSGGTMKGELRVNGGDAVGVSKIVLETDKGQITNSSTGTLFGYTGANLLSVGHSTAKLQLRGSGTRPTYNGNDIALLSDANSKYTKPSGGIPAGDLAGNIPTSKITGLASVATSGNYADLTNKPTIPTIPNITVVDNGSGTFVTDVTASGHTVTLTRGNASSYTLPKATTSALGGVKAAGTRTSAITTTQGGTTSGRYYGVEVDSNGKAFVNVPWKQPTFSVSGSTLNITTS